jgi:hypothetical protein
VEGPPSAVDIHSFGAWWEGEAWAAASAVGQANSGKVSTMCRLDIGSNLTVGNCPLRPCGFTRPVPPSGFAPVFAPP